jgi:hypothetical protein
MQHSENECQKVAAGPSQQIGESGICKEDWKKTGFQFLCRQARYAVFSAFSTFEERCLTVIGIPVDFH